MGAHIEGESNRIISLIVILYGYVSEILVIILLLCFISTMALSYLDFLRIKRKLSTLEYVVTLCASLPLTHHLLLFHGIVRNWKQ